MNESTQARLQRLLDRYDERLSNGKRDSLSRQLPKQYVISNPVTAVYDWASPSCHCWLRLPFDVGTTVGKYSDILMDHFMRPRNNGPAKTKGTHLFFLTTPPTCR